jgi:hypothetical protein
MSLLTVVKDVCAAVGVAMPTSVFSGINTNRTQQELLALANETAQRIAYDTREWTNLYQITTLIGDGVTGVSMIGFPLPVDYKRMLLSTNVWRSTSTMRPMMFIADIEQWNQRRSQGVANSNGEWILANNEMFIAPVMAVGVTAHFVYLNKNCIALSSGGVGDTFTNDADRFRIDERLLKLGMIWQWKALKGSPYAEDMATFMDALTRATGADKPSPILVDRLPSSVMTAYPYPTPSASDWGWPLS